MASNGGEHEHPIYGQEPVTVELLARVGHSLHDLVAELDEFSRSLAMARMRLQRFTDSFPVETSLEAALDTVTEATKVVSGPLGDKVIGMEGKLCHCGALMQRTGACYTCPACGDTDGCG